MARPTTRVLAVLELLQTHETMSGDELAARLGVDRRTIRRYVAALEELGIPITAERGRAGGYMLVAGFKLPPMMFTDDEALALSVGLLAARGLGLAEAAPAVASAQAKLERVMPAGLRRRVRAVDETVTLDLSRPTPPGDNAALVALSAAAQAGTRVHLRYLTRQRDPTERDVDPYGLAYRGGCWYVVGMCHLRGGLRSFRLDRVHSVRPLAAAFTRPPGFDALRHLTQAIATSPEPSRSRSSSPPISRPPGAKSSPPPACSSPRPRASCCAARPTTSPGSPGSWRGSPSPSRSASRQPCAKPSPRTPGAC